MAVCGIYKITNIINHKCYIGQSTDIFRRWREHVSCQYKDIDWHTTMQNSPENYSFEIITQCAKEDLDDLESYYIHLYNSVNNGYNKHPQHSSIFDTSLSKSPDIKETQEIQTTQKMIEPFIKTIKDKKDFPYSMLDLTKYIKATPQAIYPYMKKHKDFFESNSIRIHQKKWYSQEAFNCLLAYYGPRDN